MKHFCNEVSASLIPFFSRGARKDKGLPKFRRAVCFALFLTNILSPCVTAKAWNFQYLVSDHTLKTPNYYVDGSYYYFTTSNGTSGGSLTSNTTEGFLSNPSAVQFSDSDSFAVGLSNTSGALLRDKCYRISVKITPTVTSYSSKGICSTDLNYFVLIGGQRFDFGTSSFLYFDVDGISTDYFLIGADITTTCYPGSNDIVTFYSSIALSDISYSVTQITDYPDYRTSILDTTLQGTNSLLTSINTLSANSFAELQKHTGWLSNIYTRLGTIDGRLVTANSHLNNLNTKTETQNKLIEQTNALLENLTGGYDASDGNNSVSDFDGTLNDFDDAQSNITDVAYDGMDDFTVNSNGLLGMSVKFAQTVPLVSGMMQSMFDSSGELGTRVSVGFTLTIVAMVVGLFKFFKR